MHDLCHTWSQLYQMCLDGQTQMVRLDSLNYCRAHVGGTIFQYTHLCDVQKGTPLGWHREGLLQIQSHYLISEGS